MAVVCKGCSEEERKEIVDSICGAHKKACDIEVLSAMSALDFENQQGFDKLHKMALESFENKIFGSSEKTPASKEVAQKMIERKVPVVKRDQDAAKQTHAERQEEMTPADLKTLLPDTGGVRGLFWMRYNPVESWFRSTYPSSTWAQISLFPVMRSRNGIIVDDFPFSTHGG